MLMIDYRRKMLLPLVLKYLGVPPFEHSNLRGQPIIRYSIMSVASVTPEKYLEFFRAKRWC